MAITDEDSVLILGAGVSAPFGVPLGGTMMEKIAKGLEQGQAAAREHGIISLAGGLMWYGPYWGAPLSAVDQRDYQEEVQRLQELKELLQNQTSETIDDFIVENPSFKGVLKACIAVTIAKALYRSTERRTIESVPLDPRLIGAYRPENSRPAKNTNVFIPSKSIDYTKQKRNWIHHLIETFA